MSMAESLTGLRGRILLGVEEAHLSFGGATAGLEADPRPTVVVDVGGGSTELAGVLDGNLVSHSMQLGCVRVTERALGSDPVTPERLAAADAMIDAEIDRAFLTVPAFLGVRGNLRLVGVAGTIATLAHLDQGLATYNRDAVHHLELPSETVTYWRVRLMRLTPAERLAFAGMTPGREDVLVGGLRVLEKVMEALGASSIIHSESDILDGTIAWLRR
jgi:exopolyphosphatase/guanosine-5'-triphosphate,3'-diphosphate pyrophosphatase